MAYVIGVDVGGTFTDAVLDDDAGTVLAAKSPSTPRTIPAASSTSSFCWPSSWVFPCRTCSPAPTTSPTAPHRR